MAGYESWSIEYHSFLIQSQHYGRMPKASTVQGRQVGPLGSLHTAQNGTQGAGPMRRRQAAGISGARNKAVEIEIGGDGGRTCKNGREKAWEEI